jgi:transcriptional regulator with XRE-family HTH domain
MLLAMNSTVFGLHYRAVRIRQELTQADVGRIARISRGVISRIERGLLHNVPVGTLDRAAAAVGATLDIRLRWRGEQLDRLLDEAHAELVERVVALLRASGWEVIVEASFSIWGERGSIDVLGFHPASRTVLVVEVKSVVPDNQATLHGVDRKTRLARQIANDRGWQVKGVAKLLVVGDSASSRRRVAEHAQTYATSFPTRGAAVRAWLRRPGLPISGLMFLPYASRGRARVVALGRQRVRKPSRLPRRPPRPDIDHRESE